MSENKKEVVEAIRGIVSERGKVLGSRLAAELKASVPDWNAKTYGARSLREFVVDNVDGVEIAGRSGLDVVYSICGRQSEESNDVAVDIDPWRVWVSPNSPYALAVSGSDGSLLPLHRAADVPSGHVKLTPASAEDHRTIAREFLNDLPVEQRQPLLEIVESQDARWWQTWLNQLRSFGHLGTWNSFRRRRLRSHLLERLKQAGLDRAKAEEATGRICSKSSERGYRAQRAGTQVDKSTMAQRIAIEVIGNMSEQDLRSLRLPLGAVLDALEKLK